ncbi:adenosylcobinamide-GDP ribazoletransferase [Gymnodinialimonas hymeniacidonis]|uniref:adenosylcobinamide-GDP ribazoletransferase n=1 Tax=Gymnodinialimonas hymeniacidonis TaxID=3126508 RepID=UPI0034C608E3
MSDTDAFFPQPRDVIRAFHLLSRLPLPGGDAERAAASAWAWPLVGATIAALQVGLGCGLMALGVPVWAAAGLAVALGVVLTGGLHEDGLADCADGFWGGFDRDRRLEILKDSRVGSYGVLAMVFAVGLRWGLLASLLPVAPLALIAAAMLSRAPMALLMARMPFAREGGLANHVGRPPLASAGLAVAIAVVGGMIYAGFWPGLLAAVIVGIAAILVGSLARAKIGGQTGDVLGAAQVIGEIAALLTLAAALA